METKESIIKYINNLKGYQGYVQFSDSKIRECDIFKEFQNIKLTMTKGFIYEAHFYNGEDSITIKQVNDNWLVDKTPFSHSKLDSKSKNIETYIGINNLKVTMAQIWEAKPDDLCAGMEVMKLQKVVFVGFENG